MSAAMMRGSVDDEDEDEDEDDYSGAESGEDDGTVGLDVDSRGASAYVGQNSKVGTSTHRNCPPFSTRVLDP